MNPEESSKDLIDVLKIEEELFSTMHELIVNEAADDKVDELATKHEYYFQKALYFKISNLQELTEKVNFISVILNRDSGNIDIVAKALDLLKLDIERLEQIA